MLALCLLPALGAEATNVEDSLIVGIQSTKTALIQPLNPLERDMLAVYHLVYEGLVSIDDNYLPAPALAESWEGNGRSWTFHLRSGLTFSDGTPLTAADVVASAQAILDRANDENTTDKGYYRNLVYFISKISASGDNTVVVRATSGRSYWGLLYAMTFPVVPASQVYQDDPLGSGPYYISNFSAGSYLVLEANTNWWKNQPQVKHIHFTLHNNARAVLDSYEYGRVDAAFTRSISAAQYKSSTKSFALDCRTNQLEVLLMNQSYTKMKSEAVRKAIRAAIDIDRIASDVYMGMVTRTDTPMIPGTWMYNNSLEDYFAHDVNLARRLLAEDGWGDSDDDGILDKLVEDSLVELTLNLYVYEEPDDNVRISTANMIKDQLEQIGISINVINTTLAETQEKLTAGSFHMALVSFACDVVPDPGFMLISGNTYNYGRYRSAEMTQLCNGLRTCLDQTSYQNALYQIQELFAKDCPMVCLFYRSSVVLSRMMYTTVRDVREMEQLRGIESFHP